MFDELRTVGPRREPGALLFREARGHEPVRLPVPLQGRDAAVAGAGQRAHLHQRLGEQRIEVGALGDARVRRGQPDVMPARRPVLPRLFVVAAQQFTLPLHDGRDTNRTGAASTGTAKWRESQSLARRNSIQYYKRIIYFIQTLTHTLLNRRGFLGGSLV